MDEMLLITGCQIERHPARPFKFYIGEHLPPGAFDPSFNYTNCTRQTVIVHPRKYIDGMGKHHLIGVAPDVAKELGMVLEMHLDNGRELHDERKKSEDLEKQCKLLQYRIFWRENMSFWQRLLFLFTGKLP